MNGLMISKQLLRCVLLLLVSLLVSSSSWAVKKAKGSGINKNQVYVGGRLGISVPLSVTSSSDDVSFSDVAGNGFTAGLDGLWMYSENIGLGAEMSFATNPYKEDYWAGLNYRGSFDVKYKDFGAGLVAKALAGKKKVKPYGGVQVGVHYLMNSLSFVQSEEFYGTMDNSSVSYDYNKLHFGGSVEAGVYCVAAQNAIVTISVCFNLVPSVKETELTILDTYSDVERTIVVNPHGNQHNVCFTVGLNFGVRKRYIKLYK